MALQISLLSMAYNSNRGSNFTHEMADTKEEKTMPLELAIQRELSYRRKIEALRLHPNDKPINELLPLQIISSGHASHPTPLPGPSSVPISSPCISGTKRKEPTSSTNHQFLQHEPVSSTKPVSTTHPPLQYEPRSSANHQNLQHESMNNAAGHHPLQRVIPSSQASHPKQLPAPTSIPISSPCISSGTKQKEPTSSSNHQGLQHEPMSNTSRHHPMQHEPMNRTTYPPLQYEPRSSSHHSLLQNPRDSNLSYKPETDYLYCKICKVTCSSPFNLKQHFGGHKHRAKVQEQEFMQKAGIKNKSNQKHWCELCKIACTSEDLLEMHFRGHKHLAEVNKLQTGKQGGVISNQRKWCEICNIWCSDELAFRQHLQGKKHIYQLHKMDI